MRINYFFDVVIVYTVYSYYKLNIYLTTLEYARYKDLKLKQHLL
jgi:hypothetical protein